MLKVMGSEATAVLAKIDGLQLRNIYRVFSFIVCYYYTVWCSNLGVFSVVFYQGDESSEVTARSPTAGSSNGDYTTSGLAKIIADVSVSLRTQLTRFSVSSSLAFLRQSAR